VVLEQGTQNHFGGGGSVLKYKSFTDFTVSAAAIGRLPKNKLVRRVVFYFIHESMLR